MPTIAELAIAHQTLQTELAECQQQQEVLREELTLLTAILNAVESIVLVLDSQGNIFRCNQAFEQATGYRFAEVRDQPFWNLFLTEDERKSVEAAFRQLQSGQTSTCESGWITQDGQRCIAWSYTPFLEADGTVKCVIATGSDRADQQKEQAQKRLQETLELQVQQATLAKEQEKAAQQRAVELAKANEVLKQSLDALATEPNLDRFLGQVLEAIAEQFQAPITEYWYHPVGDVAYIGLMSWRSRMLNREEIAQVFPTHPGLAGFKVPPQLRGNQSLQRRTDCLIYDDHSTNPFTQHLEWIAHWLVPQGLVKEINMPMALGDSTIGALVIRLPSEHQFTPQQIELAQALAHQATLAIQLTQLAEKAKQAALAKLSEGTAREQEKAAQERAAELEHLNAALNRETAERRWAESIIRSQNQALTRSLELLLQESNVPGLLGALLTTLVAELNCHAANIWLLNDDATDITLWTIYVAGQLFVFPEKTLPPHLSLPVQQIAETLLSVKEGWRQTVHYLADDPRLPPRLREFHHQYGISDVFGVPLLLGDRTLGWLNCVLTRESSPITPDKLAFLEATAHQATLALQLDRLAEEAKQVAIAREQEKAAQERATELAQNNAPLAVEDRERQRAEQVSRGQTAALIKTLAVLAAEPVLDNFLGYVLQAIAEQLGEPSGGIWLYDETYSTTILHINYENGDIQRGEQITRPGGIHNVIRQWDAEYMQLLWQRKILIQDVQQFSGLPEYAPYHAYNQQQGIKRILVISLFFGEKFLGNITLRSRRQRDYKPEELELARVLAYQATLAIQLTRLAEQSRQTAVLEERNRMAREIHDTLAQAFTGIGMQLEAANRFLTTKPDQTRSCIARAHKLAYSGLAEARRSVWALQPEAAEYSDLPTALRRIVEQLTAETFMRAKVWVQGTPRPLPPDFGMNLLRIGQEALTNALRHAQAQVVNITITYEPHQIQLCVQDDGQGFDPQQQASHSGFGLMGMQQRAHRLGGTLTIISQPGSGTQVSAVVPIAEV